MKTPRKHCRKDLNLKMCRRPATCRKSRDIRVVWKSSPLQSLKAREIELVPTSVFRVGDYICICYFISSFPSTVLGTRLPGRWRLMSVFLLEKAGKSTAQRYQPSVLRGHQKSEVPRGDGKIEILALNSRKKGIFKNIFVIKFW